MSTNMTLITSVTVGSGGAASVTLPATGTIPQTYTDLKIVMSIRGSRSLVYNAMTIKLNGVATNQTAKVIEGSGSAASSYSDTVITAIANGNSATANTFGNAEVYIPNYTSSNYKSVSIDSVAETNATTQYMDLTAGLWSSTAAVTTISIESTTAGQTILEGSTFYLYGISNVTSTTKATGGIVSSDGTYNYHMFPYSGTFTPTTAISADILVVAGGGGGGGVATSISNYGGSGAAGGVSYLASSSLTAISYPITVGGGGAGGSGNAVGSTGTASNFNSSIISNGGAGGASSSASSGAGISGGSGSGGAGSATVGSATQGSTGGATGYGNAGGAGSSGAGQNSIGGSGGSGAAGGAGVQNVSGGNGGSGLNTWSSWMTATGIGGSGYIAGGGAGFLQNGTAIGTSNAGAGVPAAGGGTAATVNTGSGGGGSIYLSGSSTGGAGGSGLVIIRYAI